MLTTVKKYVDNINDYIPKCICTLTHDGQQVVKIRKMTCTVCYLLKTRLKRPMFVRRAK